MLGYSGRKEKTQTLGAQKAVTNIKTEAGLLHASVNLKQTSVYADMKRISLKQTSVYADMNRIWIRCVFSTAFNLLYTSNQRSLFCAALLTILPQTLTNSFYSLIFAHKTRI